MTTQLERLCFKEYGLQPSEIAGMFKIQAEQESWKYLLVSAQQPHRLGITTCLYLPERNHEPFLETMRFYAQDREAVRRLEDFLEWYAIHLAAESVKKL